MPPAPRTVAVAGATGHIGSLTAAALRAGGHDVVEISRARGVDLRSGAGLEGVLAGVEAVIDATNAATRDRDATVEFFSTTTANLLEAERRAGVGHHVVLSIVGPAEPARNPHYAGKLAQEAAVVGGPVPWTIVRSTQFHDFAATVVGWSESDGVAAVPPLLVQPIAPTDVAAVLAEVGLGAPQHRRLDVAGPETQDLVDMARRTLAARDRQVRLVPTWDGPFDVTMAGNVLLPGPGARIMPTTFDEWLSHEAAGG
ncbi:NAD(P)H-binding protein [Acidiferrimicrobium sp. IK]|uniref:SDR family oxidoreductase n=1 Tax=Acidiferrimicrobium sp. IK TaxID=2871700 RepID=UPI0021CB544B|nr:NAD(P)H-binding protein [Acidiferrimicrobium sp. IK]MCU4182752.1 NAD(P)H-binding protein [Acidiferrimicrobium sp. IK]